MTFAREPLQVIEIVQPLCSRTFGSAPCLATGSRCWNTDATCKFPTALDLTNEIVMRFVTPMAHRYQANPIPIEGMDLVQENGDIFWTEDRDTLIIQGAQGSFQPFQPSTAIPALISAATAPTVLNVAAGNSDISPLGIRAVAEVALRDFPYNDVGYDPYLSTRSYDPLTLGSFWSKWLVRNPYHVGYVLRTYDGYVGDPLGSMIKREYFIEKIDAARSSIRITAKDILRRVTDNDLRAPFLSNGALSADLLAAGTSFQAAGALLTDYPETGWVRINEEVIAYTSRTLVGTNVQFSGLTRGALNTVAADHSQLDQVQRVLAYEDEPFQNIIYDLLTTWGGIPTSYIDKGAWDDEKTEWRDLYNFTGYITDPVSIQQLVGEICQQAQANVWWDERFQKIILRAQRPIFLPGRLTEDANIVSDSFMIEEVAKDRASQVYVYFGLRNPTLSVTDKFSYRAGEVVIDVDKERQYGEPAIKEIFCRWINTNVLARTLGESYIRRFRDVRRHIKFTLTANDVATFWTGDAAEIVHFMDVNFDGSTKASQWLITSAETIEQGGLYAYQAEDNGSAGALWKWVAATDTRPNIDTGCWVDAAGTDGLGVEPPFGWL